MKDVVIIGAGIIGCFLAYDLSKYDLKIAVIEKNMDVASGATKANSAIVHSGHDPKEGTLKALLNVKGSRMYEQICKDLNCHYEKIGAYVLACGNEEEAVIQQLVIQASDRKIPFEVHDREMIVLKEPHVSHEVTKGLWLPSTAIITPWEVSCVLMDNAIERGTELHLNTEVKAIEKMNQGYRIVTSKGEWKTKVVINCAGVHADEVAAMVNADPGFSITARRGEYFVLDHLKEPVASSILFPVPSSKGKGVLLVPTIHRNLLLGPTSDFVDEKENVDSTKDALDEVRKNVSKLITDIPMHQVIRTFSGNRPSGSTHDFVLKEDELNEGFLICGAIESPGIASAPAISEYMIEHFVSKRLQLIEKKELPRIIVRQKLLSEMTEAERNAKISEDCRYGRIVCRCEQISEGEIVEAIHRNTPVLTLGAVKRRLRPGMGRCQGGFCEPLVAKILARELKLPLNDIVLEDAGSNVLLLKR